MFIPEREEYMKEVSKIEDGEIQASLESLYEHLLGRKKINSVNNLINEILGKMFPINNFFKEVYIPLEFHGTTIARVLFTIMYGLEDYTYTIKDVIELTKSEKKPKGYSKQNINLDIEAGKLKGEKINGVYRFTQTDVFNYLKLKGFQFYK